MTTTRRGKDTDPSFDIYDTPLWCTQGFLDEYDQLPGGLWAEPCAGSGAIVQATNTRRSDIAWTLVEPRQECEANLTRYTPRVYTMDARVWSQSPSTYYFDVLITNPPFSLAMELLQCCLPMATWVVFLLRLGFLGSMKRSAFFRDMMPDVGVIIPRPQFGSRPKGKGSDSTEYGYFIWGPPAKRHRSRGEIFIIPTPPEFEETKAKKRVKQLPSTQTPLLLPGC